VALLLLVSGVLIVAQFRTQRRLATSAISEEDEAVLLSELVAANRQLREEVDVLSAQVAAAEGGRATLLEELVEDLNRVRVLTGMVGVVGPGIEMVVDGPVHALDLQDLVNELRNAGAEAISVNGHRIVASSVPVTNERDEIILHGQVIDRPYYLQAIGDPDTIEAALSRSGGLIALLERRYPNLQVETVQQPRLILDVSPVRTAQAYARPVQ
jgi:uncharacterized protein YlxW (UPF0749 family)